MLSRFLFAVLLIASTVSAADRPPNFVVVFADDLGYADVGCFGGSELSTPHLDNMAREGRRLTSFYVAQAVCSASRTALLTGCYPNRVGILGALGPASKHGIHDEEMTIAEVLKPRGYATAIFGKWHLGHHPQFLPTRHGFDEYFGLPYSNDMWPKHPTAKFPDLPLVEAERTLEYNPDQTKLTTWYAERAVEFIEQHRDRPFFLYVPHAMPHVPLFVSGKYAGKSPRGLFGDVISEIDWSMGQILAALKRTGLDDNTLVIFTSDNGPWLSYGNHAGSAGPLREGKGTAWEGGVRVPFIARWPGKVPAGTTSSVLAATVDLLPTFAKLAGAELPSRKIDGVDVGTVLTGDASAPSPRDSYYFYWGQELHAVRQGPWKLHFPHAYRTLKEAGRDGQPGPYANATTELALYNLETDVGEQTNVTAAHPDVVQRLTALAEAARDDLGDTLAQRKGRNVRSAGMLAER
jgi:arylsulfatase A-like enzyme